MTVKTTGAEWNRFYNDKSAWPDGSWHKDEEITVNGETSDTYEIDLSAVPSDAAMTVAGGIVFLSLHDNDGPSLESYFKRWRKAQTTTFFNVECPHDKAEVVKAAIRFAGGKVSG